LISFRDIIDDMNKNVKQKTVSFSQFSLYFVCPHHYYIDYVLGKKVFEESLHMSFGTAIHETMQTYLLALYNKSEKDAEQIDMVKFFTNAFQDEITKKNIPHTPTELKEFLEDGVKILNAFHQIDNRLKYFPTDKYTLLDIEHEIEMDIRNNIKIVAYLDLVFKERITGKIKIIDIKTATNAWNEYQKTDFTKTSQLVLYKALYSKKYNIPLHMIDVEFYIVRRKLYENVRYDQSHIQLFKPKSAQSDILQVINEFNGFINECFTPEGQYKPDMKHPKIPGKNNRNCKFCSHLKTPLCNGIADPPSA
jgi:hypothetical protein